MRARAKRKQTIRRLEIIAIVAIVTVSIVVGFYLALTSGAGDALDGTTVPQSVYAQLYQAANNPSYGQTGSAWMTKIANLTGSTYTSKGKPILVFVGAEYCEFCAVQRWALTMALMRFGNFTGLEYEHSSVSDGNYATLTYLQSTYHSPYLIFEPFEVADRNDNPLQTLPSNYSTPFDVQGGKSYPFLNFENKYYLKGALPDPSLLGSENWTQVINSINTGDALGIQIKQAANVLTAVICRMTGGMPRAVCNNASITPDISLLSYTPAQNGSGSQLLLSSSDQGTFPATPIGRTQRGWV